MVKEVHIRHEWTEWARSAIKFQLFTVFLTGYILWKSIQLIKENHLHQEYTLRSVL
jgi:hypothetical protein